MPFRRIDQLQLRPEAFLAHLEGLGFVAVADLNAGSTAHRFDRPLLVLRRPGGGEEEEVEEVAANGGAVL